MKLKITGRKMTKHDGEPRASDGAVKEINPFNIGIDPGISLDVSPGPLPGKNVSLPKDPRRRK